MTGHCTGTTLVSKLFSKHCINCTYSQQVEDTTQDGSAKTNPIPKLINQQGTRELLEFLAQFEKQDPWSVYRTP